MIATLLFIFEEVWVGVCKSFRKLSFWPQYLGGCFLFLFLDEGREWKEGGYQVCEKFPLFPSLYYFTITIYHMKYHHIPVTIQNAGNYHHVPVPTHHITSVIITISIPGTAQAQV